MGITGSYRGPKDCEMKYIVGASIGGLFGFTAPLMMEIETSTANIDESPRIEDSQQIEDSPRSFINQTLILPDNYCGYIEFDATTPKEQAKECLERSADAGHAI